MFKSLLLKGRTICLLLCCLVSSLVVTAQTKHTGKVIGSDDKQPIVGASVRIKGTNTGAVTDVNGDFTLTISAGNVLEISYIGYTTKQVTVQSTSFLTISLDPVNNSLNEVVVTGYQTQVKKDISGSVATVDVASAKELNVASSENLLQGQVAGVTVTEQGAPGSSGQVLIRGIGNFGNSSPLYVIDGFQTSSMSNINPNDIESITVLKDAGATAIYGVQGGLGVVVVTTKKGKSGKTRFNFDSYYGTTSPLSGNVWNVLGGGEYLNLVKKVDPQNTLVVNGFPDYGYQGPGAKGVGSASDPNANPSKYFLDPNNPANDYLIQKFDNGAGTDWFHAVFKNAPVQQHSFTASGANGNNNYLFSMAYTDQEGTLIDTYYKRYQARFNTNFSLNDHIRVGESAQIYYIDDPNQYGNQNEGNAISMTYRMEPQIPVYDIKGNYGGTYDGVTQLGNANNPVAIQNSTINDADKSWNLEGNIYAEIDFLKHFTVRSNIGGTVYNYTYANITPNPYWSGEGHGNDNSFSEGYGFGSHYNWTNTLNYKESFGKHNVTLFVGNEVYNNYGRKLDASQTKFLSLDPAFVGINNGAGAILASSAINGDDTRLSYFGRFDYNYDSKYYIAGTIRRDGSSLFYTGRQYGNFPALSLAWRISQESFLKGVTWLNDLKLRGSYGSSGYSGNVGAGNAYSSFTSNPVNSSYPITGSISSSVLGYYSSQYGNTKTTWETDKTADFGFDASLFGHLELTAEYFQKTNSNLLINVQLPATVGTGAAPFVNAGTVQNKGFDISATYHANISKDFKFSAGANITSYKNTITDLNGTAGNFFTNYQRNGAITYDQVGSSIGEFYGYKVVGYFANAADVSSSPTQADAAPGRFKYADVNGDKVISPKDRVNLGNPNPDFTYGINLNASYKKFDLSVVLYGSYGNKDYNYIKYWTDFYSTLTGNKSKDLLYNSWSTTNLNPKTPIAEAVSTFSSDQTVNSWYIEDGSFLKCKIAQLGYTFGGDDLKAIGVSKLHIYIQGTNLFTITKYTGLDPELQAVANNGIGTDIGNYPNNEKRVIVGVNLTF